MRVTRKIKTYGWHPSLPDKRDTKFTYEGKAKTLPPSVDLRVSGFLSDAFNQKALGSCVDNATSKLGQYRTRAAGLPDFVPSRLFLYYQARLLEGTVGYDSGSTCRDGIKAAAKFGMPHEGLWAYVPAKFSIKPPPNAYRDASKHRFTSYHAVQQTANAMKQCLADGNPFIGGFSVYDSFESDAVAATGIVPMPNLDTEQVLGGHCTIWIGYDDASACWLGMNSWGVDWGDHGCFKMPYAYMLDPSLAGDLWTATVIT